MRIFRLRMKLCLVLMISCLIILSSLSYSLFTVAEAYGTQATIIRLDPYPQNASGNTVTICWTTNENNSGNNKVEYGESTGVYTHNATAITMDTYVSDFWGAIGDWTHQDDYFGEYKHYAVIDSPWATGYYRVDSAGTTSPEYTYKVPGVSNAISDDLNFIFFADSQPDEGDDWYSYYRAFLANLTDGREHDVDLLIFGGDTVGYPEFNQAWGNVSTSFTETMRYFDAPLIACVADHDTMRTTTTQLYGYRDLYHTDPNNYEGLTDTLGNQYNEQYSSYTYRQAHFITLSVIPYWRYQNCEVGIFNWVSCDCLNPYNSTSPIYQWLESDLENASNDPTISFIFVILHTSPYRSNHENTGCDTGSTQDFVDNVSVLFDRYGVDVVLQGHDHNFHRSYRIFNNTVVSEQPEDNGTTYYTVASCGTGSGSTKTQPEGTPPDCIEWINVVYAGFPWQFPLNWGYVRGNISGGLLNLTAVRHGTGLHLDNFSLNKSWSPSSPSVIQFISIEDGLNGTTIYTSTPTFNWTIVEGADMYHLQISNNSIFTELVSNITDINELTYPSEYDANATRVSFILPDANALPIYKTYYCRVRAYNT